MGQTSCDPEPLPEVHHCTAYKRLFPVKVPLVVVRGEPSWAVPEILGAVWLTGVMLAVLVVGVIDVAVAEPTQVPVELLALTIT